MSSRVQTSGLGQRPVRRWRRLLQPKLVTQLTLPAVIGLVQLGAAIVEMVTTPAGPMTALWLIAPFTVGFGLGCAIRVAWDDQAAQVVLVGNQLALTLGFVILNLGSRAILERVLGDLPTAGVSVLLVASGLLPGHSVGLLHGVHAALTTDDARRHAAEPAVPVDRRRA